MEEETIIETTQTEEAVLETTVEPTEEEAKALEEAAAHRARMAEAEAHQNERMEKIVIFAREKLLPYLSKINVNVEESKRCMESLAITIQQGLFLLMKETMVSHLDLKGKINEDYPDYEKFIELLDMVDGETMEDAIESLQWMSKKIEATLKEETKVKAFNDLGLTF